MPLFKNRKKAFARHIKKAKLKITAHRKCKASARNKGKAPSRACMKKRAAAVKELTKASALHRKHKAAQLKKGKWTSRDAVYFGGEVAAVSRLLSGGSRRTGVNSLTRSSSGRRTVSGQMVRRGGMRIAGTVASNQSGGEVYDEFDEVMADVPYDADSTDGSSFEASDADDAMSAYSDDEGFLAQVQERPLLAVAAVTLVGGVAYVAYTRLM